MTAEISTASRTRARALDLAPGLVVCVALAGVAMLIGAIEEHVLGRPLVEPLVVALLAGTVVRSFSSRVTDQSPGARFAAREILEVAVAGLGLSIDLGLVVSGGPSLLVVIVLGMAMSFGVAFVASRAMGLSARLASLVAIGNAVCGNSAIAALAPVVRATGEEVASAVGLTAVLGLALVLILPAISTAAALSTHQFGVMAGMTVYAVPQVLAAAAFGGAAATNVALLVKLTRVVFLGPIILAATLIAGRDVPRRNVLGYVPWFVWVFGALAALRTAGLVPPDVAENVRSAGTLATVIAMAGLGLGVDVRSLTAQAPRVAIAVICSLVALVAVVLALLLILNA
jgi:uncharacterized integral membrane protein (TIGR00698 family)